jgi:hypothetical protein
MEVLKQMEQMALAYDPTSAYDRIVEDKHVINKSFFFNKAEIFTNLEKEFAHFLEIEFAGNIKKQLRIDSQIYLKPEPLVSPATATKSKQKAPVINPNLNPNFGDIKPPSYLRPAPQEEVPTLPQQQVPTVNPNEQVQEIDPELKQQMDDIQMMLNGGSEGFGEEEEDPLF